MKLFTSVNNCLFVSPSSLGMATAVLVSPPPRALAAPDSLTQTNHSETKPIVIDYRKSGPPKSRRVSELRQSHGQVIKNGQTHGLSHLKELIRASTKMGSHGSLDYARKSFEFFLEDQGTAGTAHIWNSLIRGYTLAGRGGEAILIYYQMTAKGVRPDHFTFPFVLSACAKVVGFRDGVQLHGLVIKMGFDGDVFVNNSLIHFYFECGEVADGQKVFDIMHEKNVVSWTSLICGYARKDFLRKAVSLFDEMLAEGIRPTSVTMVCVISACAKLRDLDLGEKACAYAGLLGLKNNTVLVNAAVDMYMKCGAIDTAARLFHECAEKNLVLYNTIMSNYASQGCARKVLDVLNQMLQLGLQPDKVTMLSVISASAELGDHDFGMCCHGYVIRHGLEGWDNISNALIDMYMKSNKQEKACIIFDLMSKKTVVSWNSLIAGFIRNGNLGSAWEVFHEMPCSDLVTWNIIIGSLVQESLFEEALELFRVMQSRGINADKVTMVSVASACGYLGALDLAKWTHCYIAKNGIYCDMRLATALVDMFARCGDPQNAMLVFSKMKKRDVSAWTAAIGAMGMEGNGKRAIELYNDMLRQGVKPDGIVFVGLLTACSHCGLVEEGRRIFASITEIHGLSPQIVHYGCMVDLLGRAGLIEEAVDLIKGMPIKPNYVIWGALLAACRTHKNVEIATYAAERMRESGHVRTGGHVLLSNIYASVGKWADVAAVRLQLKNKGVHKVPGSSSIEIDGMIHEFTSGDESHFDMAHIVLMLHEMGCRFRDAGYAPDLTNVLLDVGEQEKQYLLSRHSEKLALAFGLINTSKGVQIRVVKNLRMCSDCHSFVKLASKIYDREIVVRDINRFHFFKHGLCSCGDYW